MSLIYLRLFIQMRLTKFHKIRIFWILILPLWKLFLLRNYLSTQPLPENRFVVLAKRKLNLNFFSFFISPPWSGSDADNSPSSRAIPPPIGPFLSSVSISFPD